MVELKAWQRQRFGSANDQLELVSLREIAGDAALRRSYVDMLRDFYAKDVKHRDDGTVIRGGDMAERFQGDNSWTPDRVAGNFYGYVSAQEALAQPEPWRLPTHTAVLVNRDKAQAVGEAWIRTPDTLIPITQWGGHTHSLIRPSARGSGFGSAMLPLSLAKAHELGVSEVHVSVNHDNPASYRRFDAMVREGRAAEVLTEPNHGRRHYTIQTALYAPDMKPASPNALARPI